MYREGQGYKSRIRVREKGTEVWENLPGIEIEGQHIAQLSVGSGFFSDEKNSSSSENFHRLNRKDCIQP